MFANNKKRLFVLSIIILSLVLAFSSVIIYLILQIIPIGPFPNPQPTHLFLPDPTLSSTPTSTLIETITLTPSVSPSISHIEPSATATNTPTLSLHPLTITPTSFKPQARAFIDANVRDCDGTDCAIIGYLLDGEHALILGQSGTGWWLIQFDDGTVGWVAHSVVDSNIFREEAPLIIPKRTPTPTPSN